MARTTRSETARRSRTSARTNRGMYVDGNTVRRLAGSSGENDCPEDRIREGSRPIETEECRRVLRRYQGRNIS